MRIPIVDKFPVKAVVFQKRGNGLTAFIDQARFMEKDGTRFYELKKHKAKFKPSCLDDFVPMTTGKLLILLYEYQRDMLVPISTAGLGVVYERDGNGKIIMEWSNNVCDTGHHFSEPYGADKEGKGGKCPHCGTKKFRPLKDEEVKAIPKIKDIVNLHALDEDMVFWGQMRRWSAEQRHKPESWLVRNKEFIMMALMVVFMIMLAYIFMTGISDSAKVFSDAINKMLPAVTHSGGAAAPG